MILHVIGENTEGSEQNQETWCYQIGWRHRGPIKIGIAGNPLERIRDIQNGCPYKLYITSAYLLPSQPIAYEVEQATLKHLDGLRMVGEWVRMPSWDVRKMVEQVIKHKRLPLQKWDGKKTNRTLAETRAREAAAVAEHKRITGVS